jgi:hypothetical protein
MDDTCYYDLRRKLGAKIRPNLCLISGRVSISSGAGARSISEDFPVLSPMETLHLLFNLQVAFKG